MVGCCTFARIRLQLPNKHVVEQSLGKFSLRWCILQCLDPIAISIVIAESSMTRMLAPFAFDGNVQVSIDNQNVFTGYIRLILVVYLTVSITGYSVYGGSMRNTVIPSLQISWLSQLVNVMITVHVLPTVVIVFSPLAQQVEEWAGVPQRHFSARRFAIRSLILFGIVFTAESVPHFSVGGSTITLMTMLLPSVFYLFLFASHKKRTDLVSTMQMSPDSADDQIAGFAE
ncbi:unnamed protein product [Heligmosomoides polygyrus]|uniref:Aa_trans domain-containing protein n=1 Tax=Heligmosomoides polygyrus TaxID=6339 RepID=A0A183F5H0_HELPZ|nr:unnamed protein product [Heligmosomoides polygyrus]